MWPPKWSERGGRWASSQAESRPWAARIRANWRRVEAWSSQARGARAIGLGEGGAGFVVAVEEEEGFGAGGGAVIRGFGFVGFPLHLCQHILREGAGALRLGGEQ